MADFVREPEKVVALQQERAERLAADLRAIAPPRGDLRALDAGCGAGAFAFALAPLVREVVGVDVVAELLAEARKRAPANVTFVEGDMTRLPFDPFSFDLSATHRTLHHVARPELAVAELARVTRPGGHVLVIDQLGHTDPLVSLALDRFERARDASHKRLLPENDLRALFEANGLVLVRSRIVEESRDLDAYLDYAGCAGEQREQAAALVPEGYRQSIGWFLLRRP